MALSVSESLSLTAYESFVNVNERSVAVFLDSGERQGNRRAAATPTLA